MPIVQRESAIRPLLEKMFEARRQSDRLFQIIKPESMYERPIPERHRIVFYLGHLEAFDWNLLHENVFGLKSFHREFDQLFAFGIDPVGGGLPADQPADWPSLRAVHDYVSQIRAALDEKLATADLDAGRLMRDGFPIETLLEVAIEHRLMHVETLAYMLHQLPLEDKIPEPGAPLLVNSRVEHRMIQIPAGEVTLGLRRDGDDFGWDNEFEAYTAAVPAFEIDRYMVTNRQFLEFVNSGGYATRSFWSDDDWNWIKSSGILHPVLWKRNREIWLYRNMFGEAPLPLDWPVYVSHAEAMAYTRWAGKSLPTEEQWQRAAYASPEGAQRAYPWGRYAPDPSLGNFHLTHWDPSPVNAYPKGQSAFGVEGMLGNGWEWTCTVFAAFPGFRPFPFYPGYSANFFDGKHFVMKGGSMRTGASMLRSSFRNWFQGQYQYVYAGFRAVNA